MPLILPPPAKRPPLPFREETRRNARKLVRFFPFLLFSFLFFLGTARKKKGKGKQATRPSPRVRFAPPPPPTLSILYNPRRSRISTAWFRSYDPLQLFARVYRLVSGTGSSIFRLPLSPVPSLLFLLYTYTRERDESALEEGCWKIDFKKEKV